MCAIFGFVNYRRSLSRSEMKELINRLSVESEVRGKDATGIAYVKHGELKVFKRAKPAHKVRLYVPEDTVIFTGHTRMTTQGDARYIYNNHPFTGKTADGSFALCHNGVLYNDSQLAKSEHLPKSKIETDSYVAAQLIEKYGRLNFTTIAKMSEAVEGSFVFTILSDKNKLFIAKGDNPLCLIHYKQLGLYVYPSTEDIMKNVLKGSFLEKLPFEVIKVTEGEIISIDKRGRFEKSSFVPNEFCYGWNYYGYRKPAYDEDELFDICGMFGVSQEDLMLLYDMGYTDEEIEGMLCDRSMLRECIEEARVLVGEMREKVCGQLDYLQVFEIVTGVKGQKKFLHIYHMQECPEAKLKYFIPTDVEVNGRAYMIYDVDHITLLLAEEY